MSVRGVLHGLMRVRGFTQDDAHIFCSEDQLEDEVLKLLDFTFFMLRTFGFTDFEVYLSTRPEKFVGTIENWEQATSVLQKALDTKNVNYEIDPGEGVFYGPKIDIKIKDVIGRSWQCSTIQIDFNEPDRFDLTYTASDGSDRRPIMIHRALLGSLERFFRRAYRALRWRISDLVSSGTDYCFAYHRQSTRLCQTNKSGVEGRGNP